MEKRLPTPWHLAAAAWLMAGAAQAGDAYICTQVKDAPKMTHDNTCFFTPGMKDSNEEGVLKWCADLSAASGKKFSGLTYSDFNEMKAAGFVNCATLLNRIKGHGDAHAAPGRDAKTTVTEFYQKYTGALVKHKRMTEAMLSPYLTPKLLKEITSTRDADVVTQAQDFELAWAENIDVQYSGNDGKDTQFYAVTLKGVQMSSKLTVGVKPDPVTGWRIASIKAR